MDSIKSTKRAKKRSPELNQPLTAAKELQYIEAIKGILSDEYAAPSTQSIRFFAGQLAAGKTPPHALDQFAPIVKKAFRQFVDDRVSERLQSVKEGAAVGNIEHIHHTIDRFGRQLSQDIFITDEEFEKFFIVDIT